MLYIRLKNAPAAHVPGGPGGRLEDTLLGTVIKMLVEEDIHGAFIGRCCDRAEFPRGKGVQMPRQQRLHSHNDPSDARDTHLPCWQKVSVAGRRGLSRFGLRLGERSVEFMGPAMWATTRKVA